MAEYNIKIRVSDLEPIKGLIAVLVDNFDDLPLPVKVKLSEITSDGNVSVSEDVHIGDWHG